MLCVPTAAAMIVQFYGGAETPRQLKMLAGHKRYDRSAPFDDYSITLFRDLVSGMGTSGYRWAERSFPDDQAGWDVGISVIETEVRAGRPVIVDVSLPASGHSFVISGFDVAARRLEVIDPDRPAPGRYTIDYDIFRAMWNERFYGGAFRSLIVTAPAATRS